MGLLSLSMAESLSWSLVLPEASTTNPGHNLHGHHAPHTLCYASLCILTDGLEHSVWSYWQMPGKCHTQLPSGSALHRGRW